MKNYTDITILLDRSGSMTSIREATESGIREFIQQHRANPSTRLTLIQFDGEDPYDVVCLDKPIRDVGNFTLQPRGMTPLCDAWCKAIDKTGERLSRMSEAERPSKVIFVVVTDGLENASKTHRRADVNARVTRQQGTYNWQFVYLGANQDAIAEAQTYGLDWTRALNFNANLGDTMRAFSHTTANTLSYSNTGDASKMDWSVEQRQSTVKENT